MTELTNNLRKEIARLGLSATARAEARAFVAQGLRCVSEIAGVYRCRHLFATADFARDNAALAAAAGVPFTIVRGADLERMSTLKTPPPVMAVMEMPGDVAVPDPRRGLVIALDSVRDPGNVGTIVRMADWFGIDGIVCSDDCADIYNPKVVQATMGALARVPVVSVADLAGWLAGCGADVYGTFLDGDDMYGAPVTANGVIVMGNEANGISPVVGAQVNRRLRIPPYPDGRETVESLNVAVAAAVVVSYFRQPRNR